MCGGQSQRRRRNGRKRVRKEISRTPVMPRSSAKPSDFCFAFILCNRELLADGPNPSVFRAFHSRSEDGGARGASSLSKEWPQAPEKRRVNLSLFHLHTVRFFALGNLDAFGNGRKPYVAGCKWDKSRGPLINPAWLIVRLTMSTPICLSGKKNEKEKALKFSFCVCWCSVLYSPH